MDQKSDSLWLQMLSRRTVLKLFGVGAIAGAVGYSRLEKPQPSVYHQDTLDLPRQVGRQTSAVVVGGGLAGLAAAYELSQRGVAVTLVERSPQLGGKIASWDIEVNGEPMRMEHGFHGFFPQYYNLFNLVEELDIRQNFKSLNFYSVVYREGYQPEVFRPSHSAFPWNVIDLAVASPNRFKWGINLAKLKHLEVFREITGFSNPETFQRLDDRSVAEWVEQDFPRGLYDLYFLPFAKSSLNAPDVMSAGELMQFFHFYFFGNPEGLAFNGTRQDMGRSLVDPIAQAITANGGRILTQATVSGLQWQDGKVSGITVQQGNGQADGNVPFWVEQNPLLSTEELKYFGAGDRLFTLLPGGDRALSLTCTHQGCSVHREVLASGDGFQCPCHGAAYDAQGAVVQGPAERNLGQYRVLKREANQVQLVALNSAQNSSQMVAEESLDADYYVLAADIPGIQHLFSLSNGEPHATVATQVNQLQTADPFAVARFWFDRDFDWEHSWFTSLSGYRLTDSITLYHRIQDDYIAWADKTGGSVVELHAYCYKEREFPTQQALLDMFEAELYEIVPDLESAQMLHRQLVNQKNFAGFPPGSFRDRPESATPVPNLLFAGDWVKMPFPCGLMERAVSSGFLAANEILYREGCQRRTLYTVQPAGVLSILS